MFQRRYNILTLQWRRCDVLSTSCAGCTLVYQNCLCCLVKKTVSKRPWISLSSKKDSLVSRGRQYTLNCKKLFFNPYMSLVNLDASKHTQTLFYAHSDRDMLWLHKDTSYWIIFPGNLKQCFKRLRCFERQLLTNPDGNFLVSLGSNTLSYYLTQGFRVIFNS